MIVIEEVKQKDPSSILKEVLSGKIHVVCAAQNGLTHLNVYAELYCKVARNFVNSCVDQANSRKQTCTLFPKANISILPKAERATARNTNPQQLSREELKQGIADVFRANALYVQSEIIYFSLEHNYADVRLILQLVKDYVESAREEEVHVKTVWFEV